MRALVLVLLFVAALPAVADPPATDAAHLHYEKAEAAYALGNYAKAADEFEQAFELKPDPAILYNAAQAHRIGGNKARALLLYQNYLRVFGNQVTNGVDVERHVAELQLAIATEEKSKSSPPVGTRAAGETVTPAAPAAAATVAAPPTTAFVLTPPPPRPLVKRPWFWAVVVGGAAVVATGISLGIVYGGSTKYPTAVTTVGAN